MLKRPPLVDVYDALVLRCQRAGVQPPSARTLARRIDRILAEREFELRQRRGRQRMAVGARARDSAAAIGAVAPLAVVQIDHTKLDAEIVSEIDREPIGRPWLTLVIDVYTRMILGFFVSLEPPGAMSVGLALVHAILPKEQWLKDLGIDGEWAVWGVMGTILVDNAGEFRGVMLHRAAFEHGIDLAWRPVKTPQYGAHIERMMGTVAVELKRLPGATGANVGERGDYRPEKEAVLTLRELERWLTVFFIKEYHQRVNRGLGSSPVTCWNDAVVGAGGCPATGLAPRPVDTETFRLDFLPCVERTIDIDTVVWDYIPYAADVLRSYARVRGSGPGVRYTFRRDPRDVSKLYFFAPDQKRYFEVPYRDRGRPPMTLWELRRTIESLRVKPDMEIDAGAIFRARAERRAIVERAIQSTRLTKKGRRDEERRRSAASARRAAGASAGNASIHASNIIPNTVTPDAPESGLPLGSPKIDKLYDIEQIAVVSPLRW